MAENTLVDKILALQDKYNQLQNQLSDPEVIADMKKYVQLNKDYKELQPTSRQVSSTRNLWTNLPRQRTSS